MQTQRQKQTVVNVDREHRDGCTNGVKQGKVEKFEAVLTIHDEWVMTAMNRTRTIARSKAMARCTAMARCSVKFLTLTDSEVGSNFQPMNARR